MGPVIERVAMLSAHTSPIEQPGTGAAGGMNVYILEAARQMAAEGVAVEIFACSGDTTASVHELAPGLRVRHVCSGGLTSTLMETADQFDVLHTHYWVSGQIGLAVRERCGIPLVHSMHTMGRVKNLSLATGDAPEPLGRITAESEIVHLADRLIANTSRERDELIDLYGAEADRVDVVHPGVDLDVFRGGRRAEARRRLGIPVEQELVLYAGRIQPHKAPDVLVDAVNLMRRRPRLVLVGGASGPGMRLDASVEIVPALPHVELADWYAAADVVCVPSHTESFGLVALEAQACGTPVVASRVGGLTTVVVDGVTGLLVEPHTAQSFADALSLVLDDRDMRASMGEKAATHAAGFGWAATSAQLLASFERACR